MSMFSEFQKIGRLSREAVVTEKIDGTNAHIFWATNEDVAEMTDDERSNIIVTTDMGHLFAGSRTRFITPANDNFGFARWVSNHVSELETLGPGRHYGEWWGSGIQRGYGLTNGEKRFSLFAVHRWADDRNRDKFPVDRPSCCSVVPVLFQGSFDVLMKGELDRILDSLRTNGSVAAPGFLKPEGVVIFHTAQGVLFKKTLEKDEEPKMKKRDEHGNVV